jgi:hypothetical protein
MHQIKSLPKLLALLEIVPILVRQCQLELAATASPLNFQNDLEAIN